MNTKNKYSPKNMTTVKYDYYIKNEENTPASGYVDNIKG